MGCHPHNYVHDVNGSPYYRRNFGLAPPHMVIRTTPAFKICSVLFGMVTFILRVVMICLEHFLENAKHDTLLLLSPLRRQVTVESLQRYHAILMVFQSQIIIPQYMHMAMNQACLSVGLGNVHYGHYDQWNPESYLPEMKFLQYGTGCARGCSEVTKITVPYLLNIALFALFGKWQWLFDYQFSDCPYDSQSIYENHSLSPASGRNTQKD